MKKQRSVFKKVLATNLLFAIIPLIVVISVICAQFCNTYKNTVIHDTENYANEYADRVRSEISASISRSDYILKYNYLIDNLNHNFATTAEKLTFTNSITTYLDSTGGGNTQSVIIYFSNDTLFENKYFNRLERLSSATELNEIFKTQHTSYYSDNTIYVDNYGKKYFTFYRQMPLNDGSILECRCYIPDPPATNNTMNIVAAEEQIGENFVTAQINENYQVCATLPASDLNRAYGNYILFFTVLGLLLIAIIVFLSYTITGRTTADINSFIAQLDEKNVFSLEFAPQATDPTELLVIKKSVQDLVTKIKTANDEKVQHILEKKRLELELLQSKIEPHLLYNSLAVVKLKAFRQGDAEIISIVDHLAAYYRTILNHGKEIVTVAEEMDMLYKYVVVNEVSHDKKYNLEIQLQDDVKSKTILHLFMQPFVENAIAHGLAGSRKDCKIQINCIKENGNLVFTVFDNGYGIPPSTLAKLNDLDTYSEGYGIKNVYQRLKLLYHDVSIHFESEQNCFTRVIIKIPDEMPTQKKE